MDKSNEDTPHMDIFEAKNEEIMERVSEPMKKKVHRRDFLKGSAGVGLAAAAVGTFSKKAYGRVKAKEENYELTNKTVAPRSWWRLEI